MASDTKNKIVKSLCFSQWDVSKLYLYIRYEIHKKSINKNKSSELQGFDHQMCCHSAVSISALFSYLIFVNFSFLKRYGTQKLVDLKRSNAQESFFLLFHSFFALLLSIMTDLNTILTTAYI